MDSSQIEELHLALVEHLRKKNLLDNPSVEQAFVSIPRHLFLPHVDIVQVYQDNAIPLKLDQSGETLSSSSQPTMMAIMLRQLDLQDGMNVLEVGTASGYNAALMKHMVGKSGYVTSLEIDGDLANQAEDHLVKANYSDVSVVHVDAVNGYAPRAQYDRIVATVGVWDVPTKWTQQLKDKGRLVAPIWLDGIQVSATFIPQSDGTYLSVDNQPCAFVYLRGAGSGPHVKKQVGSTSMVILADEIDKIDTVALHLLLSDDLEMQRLGKHITATDYWFGFQLYMMIHEPEDYVFAVYNIPQGKKAYGMEGNGIVLFAPASAVFAGYHDGGRVFSFGGADAYLEMETRFAEWSQRKSSIVDSLRLRLIPKSLGEPTITSGKLYSRQNHYLHIWLD